MRRDAEKKRLVLLEKYQLQNSWIKWGLQDMMSKDLTWREDRITWRHNCVLSELAKVVRRKIREVNSNPFPTPCSYSIAKAGTLPRRSAPRKDLEPWT